MGGSGENLAATPHPGGAALEPDGSKRPVTSDRGHTKNLQQKNMGFR